MICTKFEIDKLLHTQIDQALLIQNALTYVYKEQFKRDKDKREEVFIKVNNSLNQFQ